MNRDGLVVETDVDHQMKDDERTLIAHDPAFVQPAVDPVTEFFIKLNPAETGGVIVPASSAGIAGLGKIILSLDFTVPIAPPGFQYQIVTFATWTVFGFSVGQAGPNENVALKQVATEFTLADPASRNSTISRVPFDAPGFAPSASDSMNAEDHFLPIGPGTQIPGTAGTALLFAKSLINNMALVEQTSILVTLKLVKIRPRIRVALPLSPHRGNQVSIVASNVNVDVFSPLTTDAPATKVASIVAGERIDGIFAGVQDQSLSVQWQIGLLNPSGGATGPTGPDGTDGDTIVGPQGPTGPAGPGDLLFVYSKDGNGTPGNYDVTGNTAVDFHVIGNNNAFVVTGANQFFKSVGVQAKWRFEYYIRGNGTISDLPDYVTPLEFAIFKNGIEVAGSRFASNPIPGGPSSISATGVLTTVTGDVLELRNVTSGGSEAVSLISGNPGTAVSASFNLTIAI